MKRGDKIICIDDVFIFDKNTPEEYKIIKYPKKGIVYTIRNLINTGYGVGILLKEIKNPKINHDIGGEKEPVFMETRFSTTRTVILEKL